MKTPQLYARNSAEPSVARKLPWFDRERDAEAAFSVFDERFVTTEVAQLIGIEPTTLLAWRRSFGLIKWSRPDEGKGVAVRWSVMDLLMLRLCVVMISHGIKPREAAWFVGARKTPKEVALGVVLNFGLLLTDPAAPSLVAFHQGGTVQHPRDRVSFHRLNADDKIGDVFTKIKNTALRFEITLIDLRDVIQFVRDALHIEIFAEDAR
jgi:hypothetical protein